MPRIGKRGSDRGCQESASPTEQERCHDGQRSAACCCRPFPPYAAPSAALPAEYATMAPTSPTPPPFPPRRWVLWAVVFAVWTLLGLIDAGQMTVIYLIADKPFSWWQV